MDTDTIVLEALVRDLGIHGAKSYARMVSQVPGGLYSAQYARIEQELALRIKARVHDAVETEKRNVINNTDSLALLAEGDFRIGKEK